jgi:hypothetical protein
LGCAPILHLQTTPARWLAGCHRQRRRVDFDL